MLLQDHYLNEKMANFVRERIPDACTHAKGSGAFGRFEVTADVSQWTKAAFFSKLASARRCSGAFSIVAGESGSPDTAATARRRIKFYTSRATTTWSATTRRYSSCAIR